MGVYGKHMWHVPVL